MDRALRWVAKNKIPYTTSSSKVWLNKVFQLKENGKSNWNFRDMVHVYFVGMSTRLLEDYYLFPCVLSLDDAGIWVTW